MEHVEYQSVILDSIIKPKAYYCVYIFYAKSHIQIVLKRQMEIDRCPHLYLCHGEKSQLVLSYYHRYALTTIRNTSAPYAPLVQVPIIIQYIIYVRHKMIIPRLEVGAYIKLFCCTDNSIG